MLLNRLAAPRVLKQMIDPRRRHHVSMTKEFIEKMDQKASWDGFYAETGSSGHFRNFEWFFGFHAVQELILPVLQTMSQTRGGPLQVLDMGCGTSALGPCVYRSCPSAVRVTCADFSPVAVRLLETHTKASSLQPHEPSSALAFLELDCTRLKEHFGTTSLDLILDKGTTDALVRSKEGQIKAGQILGQCLEVLKPSGCLLQFSDEDPDARLVWLERNVRHQEPSAGVGVHEVGELRGITYFCYQISMPQK